MKRKRHTDEEIAYAPWETESGTPVAEICRRKGVGKQTS